MTSKKTMRMPKMKHTKDGNADWVFEMLGWKKDAKRRK